jgi:hypothetical protein
VGTKLLKSRATVRRIRAATSIHTGFSRYWRRRASVAATALVVAGIGAPAALACAQHQPASFWAQALESLAVAKTAHAARPAEQPKAKGLKADKWVTGSRYERTTDVRVLFDQGCAAGRERINGLVILAFGKPAYDGHSYGSILFSNRFASNEQITRATQAYANGYARCVPDASTAQITLARGTSNYDPSAPSMVKAGRKWARETMQFAKYLRNHPVVATRVKAAAAIDAEPAWDRGFRRTYDFFRGFRDARTGYLLYNFGSLDGGVGAIWNLKQAFYVSGGMQYARVVPEIYFRAQAHQWAELARLAIRTYKRPVQFAGVMTQHNSGCSRRLCGMTPREAHSQLGKALKQHPSTRDQVRMLAAVTNISAE